MRVVPVLRWDGHGRPTSVARAMSALVVLLALGAGCAPFGAANVAGPTESPDLDDLARALSEAGWETAACDPVGVPDDLDAPVVSVTVTARELLLSPGGVEAGNVTFIAANESPTPVAVSIDRLTRPRSSSPARRRVGELQRFASSANNMCTFALTSGPHDVRVPMSDGVRAARLRVH